MSSNVKEQVSIGGLRANAAAALINLSFFTGLGILIPILALILETENKFVKTYAKQTLALSVFVLVSSLLNIIFLIGTVIFGVVIFVLIAVQIFAIIKSIMGDEFEIPYINKITNILFID
ncbi:hypothetical protein EII29_01015 [Leptotrichia sp. OH3620_COT-345]|uniref:DUF4870 domain-containing protein n=1 Tax=Leptotrichia sp. OH3620_COT-345 TaxID=2491048 RepID=UPI000F6509E1|nr:DUF4870 domain-containing protein [Leptotrichia sp. OH3620_COT-345]RRD41060.1 hypothetical protein EII29_01015 [Leptotrichia sp. OH3620_COT-345]